MLFLKLRGTQMDKFAEESEVAMGVQFANVEGRLGFVLSGRVLMLPDSDDEKRLDEKHIAPSRALMTYLWSGPERRKYDASEPPQASEAEIEREDKLIEALHKAPDSVPYLSPSNALTMGLILNPPTLLPPAPAPPTSIYGHLPFTATTQPNEVFYRCEHWLTSRRVLVASNSVLGGTFGFPTSELRFVPTGFAAVGRYALPDLPPACRRYTISPPAKYTVECGASVPLHGQAGGGVEVRFPTTFTNTRALAAPVILPPL
jgi:hypothetical protein